LVTAILASHHEEENDFREHEAEIAILGLIFHKANTHGDFPFIAGFARLAFHDCVGSGGCDGCIDHNNPANGGLKKYTDELDRIYDSDDYGMSRADFYAFASVVGLEISTTTSNDKFKGRSQFKYGRKSCKTSPKEDDTAERFPSGHSGIDTTLAYFKRWFPTFSTREVVTLLGVHTLGRARMEDSGFEGRWTKRHTDIGSDGHLAPQTTLDNQYYIELLVPWKQMKLSSGNLEWFEPRVRTANDASNRNDGQPSILLNSDFCFVFNYTATNNQGNINCRTFCPPFRKSTLPCCKKSTTLSIVQEFAANNALWVKEFTNIFMKMIRVKEEDKEDKKEDSKAGKYLNKLPVRDLEDILLDLMRE